MTFTESTSPATTRSNGSRTPRLLLAVAAVFVVAGAALVLAGCETPAHDKDTNFSKYNYDYNK